MKARSLVVLFLAVAGVTAVAQAVNPFLGSWKVTWQSAQRPQESRLVITETGGSWKTSTRSQDNPCVGREVPIAIVATSPDELSIKLKFSEVIPGCSDSVVTLKRLDEKTIVGTRGKAELALARE